MKDVSINVGAIIPAYNEEGKIADTINALKTIIEIKEIIVVDDGSQDRTSQIAEFEGAKVIKLSKNFGKGYALKKGFECQTEPILLFVDADLGESAKEAIKLIKPIQEDIADVTIAKIPCAKGKGGFGMVKRLSRIGLRFLTGQDCISVLSGQRCFRRKILRTSYFDYNRFGVEFGMTADLISNKVSILEVEVNMSHRVTGKTFRDFCHRTKQFWNISQVILFKKLVKIKNIILRKCFLLNRRRNSL